MRIHRMIYAVHLSVKNLYEGHEYSSHRMLINVETFKNFFFKMNKHDILRLTGRWVYE